MPKVSIIVPVYNVQKYLRKCLNRLVNQTLDDYEVIVVNDGSPDKSQKIIDKFAEAYPHIIKPYIKENGGLSDARNFGMTKATGDYIGFVDSDDYVSKNMFKKLYDRAVKTKSDIVICAHKALALDENGEVSKETNHMIKAPQAFGKSIYESPEILAYAKSYAWNKLYKRSVIKKFKFPVGQYFEDSAVVYNILSAAKKIEYVNEPLYMYVTSRKGAITSTVNKKIFDIFKSCKAIINHYKKIEKFEELKNEIESLCLMHIHARFILFKTKGSLKLKLKYVDKSFDFLEKYFPDWQNNKYYLERRAPKLSVYPQDKFDIARESRSKLKRYYINLYISNIPTRIGKAFTRTNERISSYFTRLKNKIFDIPVITKADKALEKKLSPEELRELQLVTLDILKTVVEFCNKHNLRYYLSEGSLLGGVRHGGFIPWDDDMDIAMPREDYEKFLKLWGMDVHNECRLYHQSTYPKYYLTFAKVIFTGKCKFSSLIRLGLKSMREVKGPGIDIFPLDETAPLSIDLLNRASKIREYRNILLTKVYYIKNLEKRKLYRKKSYFMSYKALHKKLVALYTKDQGKGEQFITNFASSYSIAKEIFPKDWFEPAQEIMFEDLKVTIPYKSHEVLTKIYGDYMTPPPEDKQVCPHKYIVTED